MTLDLFPLPRINLDHPVMFHCHKLEFKIFKKHKLNQIILYRIYYYFYFKEENTFFLNHNLYSNYYDNKFDIIKYFTWKVLKNSKMKSIN